MKISGECKGKSFETAHPIKLFLKCKSQLRRMVESYAYLRLYSFHFGIFAFLANANAYKIYYLRRNEFNAMLKQMLK